MKSGGIVRKMDAVGRITLPKEVRRVYDIQHNDGFAFFVENDQIILQKYQPFFCVFCGGVRGVCQFKNKNVCIECRKAMEG